MLLAPSRCIAATPPTFTGNHVRAIGDQSSERFEKKWAMSALEYHWEAHIKQCALEDAVRLNSRRCVSGWDWLR